MMECSSTPRFIERLVRQKRTGLYFKNPCEWTSDRNAARRFEDVLSAVEACGDWRLHGVQLVLKDIPARLQSGLGLGTEEDVVFVQTNMDAGRHRDAVRFNNCQQVLLQRLQTIALMNHHVRNALQVLAYSQYERDRTRQAQIIRDAILRIDWALKEILGNSAAMVKPQPVKAA